MRSSLPSSSPDGAVTRQPGTRVGDALILVRPLGRGAMGEVWLARHNKLKHELAIKFLQGGDGPGTLATQKLERFQFEGQVAARLAGHSRHIVAVHDTGTTADGEPYLVMEYVRGTNLEKVIDEVGPLGPQRVAAIVDQVAEVLEIAHDRGVLHRDLKPSNIMLLGDLDGAPIVKVADFGVAKMLSRDHDLDAPTPTHEGFLVGSPAYMSPDQLTSASEPGPEADLWALAVVAYEALTGWAPFNGNSMSELTVAICKNPHDPITAHDDRLPAGLDAFFERALAKRTADRFASPTELAQAFRRAVVSDPLSVAAPPRKRDRRATPWFIGLGVVVTMLIPVLSWRAMRETAASTPNGTSPEAVSPSEVADQRTEPRPTPEPPPTADPTAPVDPGATRTVRVAPPPTPLAAPVASPAPLPAAPPPVAAPPPPATSSSAPAKPFNQSETL